MIKNLVEFIKTNKERWTTKESKYVKVREGGGYCETCWYPSEWETQTVETIDWEEFEKAVKEFEASFQSGGDNSHRNPLVKEQQIKFNIGDRVITLESCAHFYKKGCTGTVVEFDGKSYKVQFDPNQEVYQHSFEVENCWYADPTDLEIYNG